MSAFYVTKWPTQQTAIDAAVRTTLEVSDRAAVWSALKKTICTAVTTAIGTAIGTAQSTAYGTTI